MNWLWFFMAVVLIIRAVAQLLNRDPSSVNTSSLALVLIVLATLLDKKEA